MKHRSRYVALLASLVLSRLLARRSSDGPERGDVPG